MSIHMGKPITLSHPLEKLDMSFRKVCLYIFMCIVLFSVVLADDQGIEFII